MASPAEIDIQLPAAPEPVVSVVVLVTRQTEFAERCLRAIARGHDPAVPTEVVLVMNACDAEMRALVKERTTGARCVRSPVNTGTAAGWNLGFAAARGRWVALLHEDSEPEPGWLGPLLETAQRMPRAAVIGSRLMWSDPERHGQLWNRGHVMWSDAMPGDLTDEAVDEDGPYVCDYCSSAAAMIEREAWRAVGGFDERYFPAMRTDLDLCMALWRVGRIVVCDQRSRVRHRGEAMVRPGGGAFASHEFRAFLAERSRLLMLDKWGDGMRLYEDRWDGPWIPVQPTAELRKARARTEARAAAELDPLDAEPRAWRGLTAPKGEWPDAVDGPMERRFVEAQLAVQREFCDELLGAVHQRHALEVQVEALEARVVALQADAASLAEKALTHDLILAGRWWRLRRRIDPAVRLARRLGRRTGLAKGPQA
jgi:GT2 family glycosyltransferase